MDFPSRLSRLVRTSSSEIYLIWSGDRRVGQVDVHFAHDTIHATIILEADFSYAEEEQLIAQIDEQVVESYLPRFERDDFVAHVFRAEQINRYTDASGAVEDLEDMEEVEGADEMEEIEDEPDYDNLERLFEDSDEDADDTPGMPDLPDDDDYDPFRED
ncbi:MAG: hypothetical protein GX446_04000 [Chthonomonadales bacterium]|nr:hypothetical protein [Chthonomonadales bacterium]